MTTSKLIDIFSNMNTLDKKNKVRIAILGCGSIGSLLDEKGIDPSFPKTHIHAILKSPFLEIVGISDKNTDRLKTAQSFWGIKYATTSFTELLRKNIDILVIATPVEVNRRLLIEEALESGVKAIFCEKPVALTLEETKKIKELLEVKNIPFLVNYIRRFDSHLKKVQEILQSELLGTPQKIIVNYGKGFKNNGSHVIDLLCWYFGYPSKVHYQDTIDDPFPNDPTIKAVLSFPSKDREFDVHFLPQSSEFYTCLEIDIFLTQGRIRINDSGRSIEIYEIDEDNDFPGYTSLKLKQKLDGGLKQTFPRAYEELYQMFTSEKEKTASGIDNSLAIFKIINAAEKSKLSGRVEIIEG